MIEVAKKLLKLLPFHLYVRMNFFRHHRYWPSINNPKTFSEKIISRKYRTKEKKSLLALCSDKYSVRKYVKGRIGEKYLIPLIYWGEMLDEQKLIAAGKNFVVKTTHDSGTVHIVKETYNQEEILKSISKSLKYDFGEKVDEKWYSEIKPRVVIEKLLIDKNGNLPEDYKFHVFNNSGNVKVFLQVDYDRHTDHNRTIYDEHLNIMPFSIKYKNNFRPAKKLRNYTEMVKIARKLAEDFEYARIDLYNIDSHIYFGEITFAHGSGYEKFSDKAYDVKWGEFWHS